MEDKVNQDTENLEGSQPDQKSAEDKTDVSDVQQTASSKSDDQKTSEEIIWDSLKGTTQDRIKELIQERDDYKEKLAQQDSQRVTQTYQPPNQTTQTYADDEVDRAVATLKEKGKFATQDDLYALVNQVKMERDHDRLESKYDGSDGLPKYDKEEVRDYMDKKAKLGNYIGDPEAAFRNMYFDEFVDAGRKQMKKKPAYTSEKPTASSTTSRNEPMTLESFRAELNSPEGREKYAKLMQNPQKFDALIATLTGAPVREERTGIL